MYKIHAANKIVEKRLENYIRLRRDIPNKLNRLKLNPHGHLGAHPLHGRLKGKWSCWLGANIRIIYTIDDFNKIIYVEAIGTHKLY